MNNGRTLFISCAGNRILDRYNEVNSVEYYWHVTQKIACLRLFIRTFMKPGFLGLEVQTEQFGVGNSVRAVLSTK